MKKNKLSIALVTALLFLVGTLIWFWRASLPVSGNKAEDRIFVVQKGESLTQVAFHLQEAKLVKSALAFRLWVMAKGLAKDIQAGSFRVAPSLSPVEIAESLTRGTLDLWLTFPEGWRREQIGQRLTANLENFSFEEFIAATRDLEGRLFPDTYLFPVDADSELVLRIISQNFENKLAEIQGPLQDSGLTLNEVLIFASLVEREAKHSEDRPLIAGILIKRYHEDWPLQVDAAVQYAVADLSSADWWPKVTKSDLQIKSPYNTYLNKGLPPAPICNPGMASIKAVVSPRTSDYWFYLADPSGQTHFAVTAEEHAENVRLYLR